MEPVHGALSAREQADLRCLAGMMIPASSEYGVPGADDPVIFQTILASLGRDTDEARAVLQDLAARSKAGLAQLEPAQREAMIAAYRAAAPAALNTLHRVVLLCYYRDDRVVAAMGRETRPPFPRGYEVEQGDWSILDPVRKRPKIWRDPGR